MTQMVDQMGRRLDGRCPWFDLRHVRVEPGSDMPRSRATAAAAAESAALEGLNEKKVGSIVTIIVG